MLETPQAVVDALGENSERPYGTVRNVAAEELVQAAEQFEDPGLLVTALLELMEGYEYSGEHRKSPVVFARLLKLWDDSPDAFDEWETVQVFWRFKWVTTSLMQVPDVPLTALHGWLDEMRERYLAAGHGLQPVAALRHRLAVHTGAATDETYDLWVTRPRERMSDCQACEMRHRALHHVRTGEDERALEIWAPVLDSTLRCQEEPWVSQACALLPLVRTGRLDQARSAHLVGYRHARGDAGKVEELGLHLEFCALTRNEGRGLEILAENRALFGSAGAPLARLHHLTGVEILLSRIVAQGHGSAAVGGPLGRSWTAEELLAHTRREADTLAAAFDARNGTSAVSDRRRLRVERPPLVDEPLPLGLRVRAGPGATGAAPAPAPVRTTAAVQIPEEFTELVRKARELAAQAHPADGELWRRIATAVAEPGYVHDATLGPRTLLLGQLAEERAFAAREEDRHDDAAQALAEAVRLFDEGGHHWHAVAARARAAALPFEVSAGSGDGATDHTADWAALDEVLAQARRLATEDEAAEEAADSGTGPGGEKGAGPGAGEGEVADAKYLTVLRFRLHAAFVQLRQAADDAPAPLGERFDAAVSLLTSEAERLASPRHLAVARQYAAGIAARTGRLETAVEELRAALRLLEECGHPWLACRPMAQLAEVLLCQGEYGEAVTVLQQALAGAARYGDASFPVAPTSSLLGHALAHLGDVSGAVRYLTEAAGRMERDGDAEGAAAARMDLADLFSTSGQDADSVAILESLAQDDASARLDERMLAQIRLSLARGLGGLGEHRASAEEFVRLADSVAGWEDQETHTMVAAQTAVALARADRLEEADACYERAVASHRRAANPVPVLAMMREFAGLAVDRDGPEGLDAALGHLRAADELCAGVPEESGLPHWFQRGSTHYERARLLARVEHFADALAEAERAMSAHAEGGPDGEEPRAESLRFAALVEAHGLAEPQQAVARLAGGVRRCEEAGLPEAAKILAALRDDLSSG